MRSITVAVLAVLVLAAPLFAQEAGGAPQHPFSEEEAKTLQECAKLYGEAFNFNKYSDALEPLRKELTVLLAVLVAFVPRKRTVRRLAALSAAIVIAFQLTVNYWFYAYITWFEPFVFLSLLLATNEKTPLDGEQQTSDPEKEEEPGDDAGERATA